MVPPSQPPDSAQSRAGRSATSSACTRAARAPCPCPCSRPGGPRGEQGRPSLGSHPVDVGPLPSLRKPLKSFMKKNNPKDEALAKLGIGGAHIPASVRPPPVRGMASHLESEALCCKSGLTPILLSPQMPSPSPGKGPPPAVAPRPKVPPQPGPSSSIKENRGLSGQTPPAAQAPSPPPAPPLPLPEEPGAPSTGPRGKEPSVPLWASWGWGRVPRSLSVLK